MTVHCKHCNRLIEVDQRKYNLYIKNNWNFYCEDCKGVGRRKRETHICATCGTSFERWPSSKKSKYGNFFCSKSCAAKYNNSHYRKGENNPNWVDGNFKHSGYAKKAFRSYSHRCAICGLEEDCCLEVHHIDKNKNNDELSNLIIVCANCHRRIHRGGYIVSEMDKKNRELV